MKRGNALVHPQRLLLLLLLLILCCSSTKAGVVVPPPSSRAKFVSTLVIVRLNEKSSALGGDPNLIQAQQKSFLEALEQANISHSLQRSFDQVLNALTLRISKQSDAYAIARLPGVDIVSFVRVFPAPEKPTSIFGLTAIKAAVAQGYNLKPDLGMTNVTEVHQLLNITGSGVKVGIIDTGIDYTHPAFGACSAIGPSCRVAYGYDLVGNNWRPDRKPRPDPDPMDCYGHGTHVAGIVGAKNDVIMGVAPSVTLGAYKIFGCQDGTTDDLVIAGMEMALNDSMDIINLSLRGGPTWPQDPLALAADAVTEKGIIVVSALGDNGGFGLWQGSAPALSTLGVGVGSVDNVGYFSRAFQVTPSAQTVPYTSKNADKVLLLDALLAVSSNSTRVFADACRPYRYLTKIFLGKIFLIRAGYCDPSTKAINAQDAGAAGVVIYNNRRGLPDVYVYDKRISIPVVGISRADGKLLVKLAKHEIQSLHWLPLNESINIPNPTGGQLSFFSSWGPSPDLSIKPDIAAPGGLIFSSIPLRLGAYATLSGTTMASPHAAGVAALYLAARSRKVLSSEVKQALQNGAVPVKDYLFDGGLSSSLAGQGAGLLNALNTVRSTTLASPSALRLGFLNQTQLNATQTLNITNTGSVAITYAVSHLPALTINAAKISWDVEYFNASATAAFSTSSFTLAPGQSQAVSVSLDLSPAGIGKRLLLFSGHFKIAPVLENSTYSPVHVPYMALCGNPAAFVVQAPYDYSGRLPALITRDGKLLRKPGQEAEFTFATNSDVPVFYFILQRPAYALSLELYEVDTNKFLGYVANLQYLSVYSISYVEWVPPDLVPAVHQNASDNSVWVPVPDGTYYINMTTFALPGIRPPEVWRSPKIIIITG